MASKSATLTASAKKQITKDWMTVLPALGEYEPLHLLRRVGPILQGVVLERDSSNVVYRPSFHVHNLVRPFQVVSMSLAAPLRTQRTNAPDQVSVSSHAARFGEAAARLQEQAPLPLSGNLSLDSILTAYEQYAKRPGIHYEPELYEDMAGIATWAHRPEQAMRILDAYEREMSQWPPDVLSEFGTAANWKRDVLARIGGPDEARASADEHARQLKADQLPTAEVVV
jgi:hypothetical protein